MSTLALAALLASGASAASPREQLKALTTQLQASPSDDALRGRVIALAKTLKPAPAVPEEARRAFIRGNTAFKGAKDAAAYARAAARYEEASNLAPWWPDPYFNRAKADDAAGRHDAALRTLKFYVAAANTAAEKRQGQDLIYEVEEKSAGKDADVAAAANSAAAAKARAQASIEGTWSKLDSDGTTWDPMFAVTRTADGFAVKSLTGVRMDDIRASETSLSFSYTTSVSVALVLRREGNLLVGTETTDDRISKTVSFTRQ